MRAGEKFTPGLAVENLSRGGAFVRSPDPLQSGTAVIIDLVRPGLKKAIHLSGRVVSVVSPEEAKERRIVPGMGVQFDPCSSEVEARLNELLALLASGSEALKGDSAPAPDTRPQSRPGPPVLIQVPAPVPPVAPKAPAPTAKLENANLMPQVKGLLLALEEAQQKLAKLEHQNGQLRAEVIRLRGEFARMPKKE